MVAARSAARHPFSATLDTTRRDACTHRRVPILFKSVPTLRSPGSRCAPDGFGCVFPANDACQLLFQAVHFGLHASRMQLDLISRQVGGNRKGRTQQVPAAAEWLGDDEPRPASANVPGVLAVRNRWNNRPAGP